MKELDVEATQALLNRIMEFELAGVVRYTHYSLMIAGPNRIPIVQFMKAQATESLLHALDGRGDPRRARRPPHAADRRHPRELQALGQGHPRGEPGPREARARHLQGAARRGEGPQRLPRGVRVVFFRRQAEVVGEYLKKGGLSTLKASSRPRNIKKKVKIATSLKFVVSAMKMLGSKTESETPAAPAGKQQSSPKESPYPKQRPHRRQAIHRFQ